MRNLLQEFIAEHDDWAVRLERDYFINIVQCTFTSALVSLKYDQTASPMDEPLVQQCRGAIVNTLTRRVLAWPYNKFWNLGEGRADRIDWSTACVQEKLDGSLMIVYEFTPGEWCIGSSGTPQGHGSFGSSADETFSDAFQRTWTALGYQDPSEDCSGYTLMFEFCAQPNRIVVRHTEERIVLHGARCLATGEEVSHSGLVEMAARHSWEVVRAFSIATPTECLQAASVLDPLEQEGYVVVDAGFNRVKVKSPRYVALHHLKGAASPRRAIELWQSGEWEELLAHFPEMKPDIEPFLAKLDDFAQEAFADHHVYSAVTDRKQFAACVASKPYSAVLFRHFGKNATKEDFKAALRAQSTQSLERLLGV